MPPYQSDSTAENTATNGSDLPHHGSDHSHNSHSNDYYITRQALNDMEASVQSVLNYLASEGLSQASLNQLSSSFRLGQYVDVLRRAQEYMQYLCHRSISTDTLDLFLRAWTAVSVYLARIYKQSHCHYMQLRRSHKINMLAGALQKKMELGECCCQAQKEGIVLERRKKQLLWKQQQQPVQ
jgi:hypothetical protein